MKSFVLKNGVAKELVNAVAINKTSDNKIRFAIGVREIGENLACKAFVVNGGMQVEIGFSTKGISKDYKEGEPLAFAVKAADFINHISPLLAFESDISCSVKGSHLVFNVRGVADVKIPLVKAEQCEPLMPDVAPFAFVLCKITKNKLMGVLKTGGHFVENDPDARKLSDRIVLAFNNNRITAFSSDGFNVASCWTDAEVKYSSHKHALAVSSLSEEKKNEYKTKLAEIDVTPVSEAAFASLSAEAQAEYRQKLQTKNSVISALVEDCKNNGYIPNVYKCSISSAVNAIIGRVLSMGEEVILSLSERYLVLACGSIRVTCPLAGEACSLYETMSTNWDIDKWSGKCIVDRDQFMNALSVMKLGDGDVAKLCFKLSFKDGKLLLEGPTGNKMRIASSAQEGNLEELSIHLSSSKFSNALSKMPSGNVVVMIDSAKNNPAVICNGNLSGEGRTAVAYSMGVFKPSAETSDADEKESDVEMDDSSVLGTEQGVDVDSEPDTGYEEECAI